MLEPSTDTPLIQVYPKSRWLGKWCIVAMLAIMVVLYAVMCGLLVLNSGTLNSLRRALPPSPVPVRYAVPHVTPRELQLDRGTCWDFATVGVLENNYRENGIEKGYLQANEFVPFSEQAYAIQVMKACAAQGEVNCLDWGDFVADNSSEGGEIGWLYYLPAVWNQVLPMSVCPYQPEPGPGPEHQCPGVDQALAQNPVSFTINSMTSCYDTPCAKEQLYKTKRVLGWSSQVWTSGHYLPCVDEWANRPECAADKRVHCPLTRPSPSEYCARIVLPGYTMDGEWYKADEYIGTEGHAMLGVGWNDAFTTHEGDTGGWIIRNNWVDRVYNVTGARGPRGSHSIAWFMGEISDWDEKLVCPNPGNPRNWLSCVDASLSPWMAPRVSSSHRLLRARTSPQDDGHDLTLCLNDTLMANVLNMTRQALDFVCTNEAWGCRKAPELRYFLISADETPQFGPQTGRICMVEYNRTDGSQAKMCLPPLPWDAAALAMEPTAATKQFLQSDPMRCGYYFLPYRVLNDVTGRYGIFNAVSFDITWADRSYVRAAQSGYNYTLLSLSTGIQPDLPFSGPYPWNRKL